MSSRIDLNSMKNIIGQQLRFRLAKHSSPLSYSPENGARDIGLSPNTPRFPKLVNHLGRPSSAIDRVRGQQKRGTTHKLPRLPP